MVREIQSTQFRFRKFSYLAKRIVTILRRMCLNYCCTCDHITKLKLSDKNNKHGNMFRTRGKSLKKSRAVFESKSNKSKNQTQKTNQYSSQIKTRAIATQF